MAKKRTSPALQLISLVWEHNREATGFSWQRLNASMHEAVRLAISAGMRFDEGDMSCIGANFRPEYWLGNEGGCGEYMYARACQLPHESACVSFEKWFGREPLKLHGRRLFLGAEISDYLNFNAPLVKPHEHAAFPEWCVDTGRPTVTSIGTDFVGITSYKGKKNEYPTKVARRWKVTKDDIAAVNKLIRDSQKAAKKSNEAA